MSDKTEERDGSKMKESKITEEIKEEGELSDDDLQTGQEVKAVKVEVTSPPQQPLASPLSVWLLRSRYTRL